MTQSRPGYRIQQGREWSRNCHSLIVLEVRATPMEPPKTSIELRVHFRPYRIPLGEIVKATFYLASTGAFVSLLASGGTFSDWTRQPREEAKTTVQERGESGFDFSPKLKIEAIGVGKVDAEFFTAKRTEETTGSAEFVDNSQVRLSDKCIGQDTIEWDYGPHRGPKAVRDFLDETLHLGAVLDASRREEGGTNVSVGVTATAGLSDCAFFGPNRRAVTGLHALLLQFKMNRLGIELPTPGTIEVVCDVTS